MARLRQRVQSYRTAETNLKRKQVALMKEFSKELHVACKNNDMEYFTDLKTDFINILGEAYMLTVISIGQLHKIDPKYYQ